MSGKGAASPDDIGEPAVPSSDDPRARRERDKQFDFKPTFTDLRNERFSDQSRQLRREHWVRLGAAALVFFFVLGWLTFVGVVVLLAGASVLKELSEKVLIALLATTTVTVVGLLAAVVRYLFPTNPAIFGQDSLPTTRGAKAPAKKAKKKDE